MDLVITLRKEVEDREEGRQIFELVKERLKDREDIQIRGHVTNRLNNEEKPQ